MLYNFYLINCRVNITQQIIGAAYKVYNTLGFGFLENEIIVELKSVNNIVKVHEVQLVNYLNGLNIEIGLLINFGPSGVDVKRRYRKLDRAE